VKLRVRRVREGRRVMTVRTHLWHGIVPKVSGIEVLPDTVDDGVQGVGFVASQFTYRTR